MTEAERPARSFALLISIIDRPTETLAQVAATPRWRWVWPTLLIVISFAVYLAVAAPYIQEAAQKAIMLQLNTMPEEQAAAAKEQMMRFTSLPAVVGSTAISGLAGTIIGWFIAAGILYFGSLIASEDLEFGPVLAITPWLWLPFAIRNFVQAAWVAWRGALITTPGLSGLVATGNQLQDARNLAFALLGYVDLFSAWHLVLVYAGLRALTRMRANKAIVLTAVYAALSLAIRLIPVLIGRAFTPGG